MRKLLFTIALIGSLICNAQTDIDIVIQKINNLDSISARTFANEIAESSKTGYEFFKLKKREKYNQYIYYYIQKGLNQEEKEEQRQNGCDKCINVVFNVYYDGANKDLEIEGKQRLRFDYINGSFLDLFPTWKREFDPEATHESIMNGENDIVRNGNVRVYQFVKFNGVWEIRNQS